MAVATITALHPMSLAAAFVHQASGPSTHKVFRQTGSSFGDFRSHYKHNPTILLRNQQSELEAEQSTIAFALDFGGQSVQVELSSSTDIPSTVQHILSQVGYQYNPQDIERVLRQTWDSATLGDRSTAATGSSPPSYNGPTPPPNSRWDAECSIELPSGLVVELGPSTIGEAAGMGLFVRRTTSSNGPVLQTQGSAFCGYGPCEKISNSLEGLSDYQRQRTFEFVLPDSLESYVWFDGKLVTVWDAMKQSQATSVRSHVLDQNQEGELFLTPDVSSPCYLIPPTQPLDPQSITIQTIGHMCNDLAGGMVLSKEEYDTASDDNNLLVLVPRVVVRENGMLEPSGMPILTLAKTIVVANTDYAMEVGLRYGHAYWRNEV
ncbi:hypothetical protein IV203_038548 [Nitzschia inconspicua]|uniref:Uncharacterized protein n=1 Tax=Nitzschia inconspicua TaxID=303405 RepID=A0A9K3LMU0_9STRA|nr:hypothetical protein IV203_038548 [Nitzschia inconspicua]